MCERRWLGAAELNRATAGFSAAAMSWLGPALLMPRTQGLRPPAEAEDMFDVITPALLMPRTQGLRPFVIWGM